MGIGIRIGATVVAGAMLAAGSHPVSAAPRCVLPLYPPVSGKVVRPFEPAKTGGHFGVDLDAPRAAVVRAPAAGIVTFTGRVAGMRTVTIAAGPGVKVSLSFLSQVWVAAGQRVWVGRPVGRSGVDNGRSAVHLSLRASGRYIDPGPALRCGARQSVTRWGLRLLPPKGLPG